MRLLKWGLGGFVAVLMVVLLAKRSHSGDAAATVIKEVGKCGGHTQTNMTNVTLFGSWSIERDKYGFQMVLTDVACKDVDRFMLLAFGSPIVSVETNSFGQPFRVWSARQVGVGMQLVGTSTNGAKIICLRPVDSAFELMEKAHEPWWRRWW